MIEPTLDDYARRLKRLLAGELQSTDNARAMLAADGAKSGQFSDTSSRFRLMEAKLIEDRFVAAIQVALSECRRVASQTPLDREALLVLARQAVSDHLDTLVPPGRPPLGSAFQHNAEVRNAQTAAIREALGGLVSEIFHEFERGLYVLPGDLTAPVIINMTSVTGSIVGAVQQAGARALQRGGEG